MSLPKSSLQNSAESTRSSKLRVMIVDDSAVIRGLLSRYISDDPDLEVVALANDGQQALNMLEKHDPELVILDIEMPIMDGMTALPRILEKRPSTQVLIASTLTERNAAISLKALQIGAADYITKPAAGNRDLVSGRFKAELSEKLKAIGHSSRKNKNARLGQPKNTTRESTREAIAPKLYAGATVTLRKEPKFAPSILAIGSSTGGPQALTTVFKHIGNKIKVPILVTQHMPPTFTAILAENLATVSKLEAAEAIDGEPLRPGRIYVAPGNFHMTVKKGGAGMTVHTNQEPPENFCRPAVDPMLRSLSVAYGSRVLAVILTGMGHDGTSGAKEVVAQNGYVIAQDESTSVVWGMPGSAATAGVCSKVLQLSDVGPYLLKIFGIRA